MKKSNLPKLIREAVMIRHIDPERGNLEAQAQRMAVYFPNSANLGDDTLSQLSFRVDASAFEGMGDEEIKRFVAAQFPEHSWGYIFCTPANGLLSVTMVEAKAYISTLVRKRAEIIVYDDIKKKHFMLGVDLDASKVLPFMDEDEFVQLVINQFPHHDWCDAQCCKENGLITVKLSSRAMRGKAPQNLGAKSITLISNTYMTAIPLGINCSLEPLEMVMNGFSMSLGAPAVRVVIHSQQAKAFGEGNVLHFIEEQFPGYSVLPDTKDIGIKAFSVTLVKDEHLDFND